MDRIFLSCWFRGATQHNLLSCFEKILGKFPFSQLARFATVRVYALEIAEPPALERRFELDLDPHEFIETMREFENADCAYQLDAAWDLMRRQGRDWKLTSSPVTFTCYGPQFGSGYGEQLLIDFGPEEWFLPEPPGSPSASRANVRSLLHLATDIARTVPLEKRSLWSESGENLALRIEELAST